MILLDKLIILVKTDYWEYIKIQIYLKRSFCIIIVSI